MSRTPRGSSSQTVRAPPGPSPSRPILVFAQLSGHATPRRSSTGWAAVFDFSSRDIGRPRGALATLPNRSADASHGSHMSTPTDTYVLRRPQRDVRFRLDYAGLLNAAQLEAVTAIDGPVLVV